VGEGGEVMVEFFGVPRHRVGRAELAVAAGTLAEVLAAVERACPALRGLLREGGHVAPHYLVSIDGERFLTDLGRRVPPGGRVLLLSADAGG
jgi:hypothetical protein